mgnify:CR=1 FL=1
MISVSDVTVAFGGFTLLDGVSFHIGDSDKIGLVGKNGAGKSTLMRLITGEMNPTSGRIEKPSGIRIGYLPQLMSHNKGRSVLDEVMTVFDHLHRRQDEMDRISTTLAERTDYESAEYNSMIERLEELSTAMSLEGGESPSARARRTLAGLGFKPDELSRSTETFSQGWNMRIELAKILLSDPDVLLLDEPTNHLDIESIEWFEDYLKNFRGSVLLVSHDRKFLDNVTHRTVEILLGHIHDYKVPYSQYVELRKERMEQQKAAYANQQRMIEKTEDFINRFRYKPTKSNQVQSRIKALEKLERIEMEDTDSSTLALRFPPASRTGDVVFKGTDLTVGYPGKVVFSGADVEIRRGDKVALVGRNGEGKTTLMRVITGELAPISGEVRLGHNVNLGYYAQNQEDILDGGETVLGTLDRVAVGEIRTRLRDILGAFLFKGDDIDKKVAVLSGGERARLGMARLMLSSHNVLALDEPTNHMDIRSKDVLKGALSSFDGTLIVVSHDRDFLDGLVDKVYEFRDGRVTEHLGGVSEFLSRRRLESLRELERQSAPEAAAYSAPDAPRKNSSRTDYESQKNEARQKGRLRRRADFLEKEIDKLEKEMAMLEKILSNPKESDDIMELTRSYLELKIKIDSFTDEWGSLIEELE